MRVCVSAVAVCALATSSATGGARASASLQVVHTTDLGTLGGGYAEATDVNESGQVVGRSEIAGGQPLQDHAFSWTASGGMVDLGTLGGPSSDAADVADSGQVVGWSETSTGVKHAFSWTAAGGMVDLGTLYGGSSEAVAVNESGQVVGTSDTTAGATHAFSWTAGGGMVDLGTLGGRASLANGVNDAGQVAGTSGIATGADHAFLWTPKTGMADLGTLGGPVSFPTAVNETGEVVGGSDTASTGFHAFSWTPASGMVDLGTPNASSSARAVNDRGQVVGEASGHAFSWTAAGGTTDLGTLFGDTAQSEAVGVNDSGLVVGRSSPPFGASWASAWTATGDMVGLGVYDGNESHAAAVNDRDQIVGEAGGHAALWTLSVPFASLDASAVVAVPPGVGNDSFVLNANFTLGDASNGIDPATEPVTLELAGASLTVPAGSFGVSGRTFVFAGKLAGGRLVVIVRPAGPGSYRITATGSGYDLSAAALPLTVQLTVGDDTGSTDAKAVIAPPPAR
jgi:probable HAF family extracellular repeat protein